MPMLKCRPIRRPRLRLAPSLCAHQVVYRIARRKGGTSCTKSYIWA